MKKYMLVILMIAVLSAIVIAAGFLNVSPSSESKTSNPNESVTSILTLSNANPDSNLSVSLPGTITMTGARNNFTANVNYDAGSPVNVVTGGSVDIKYNFTVPLDAFSEAYNGALNFTAGGENFTAYALSLNVLGNSNLKVGNLTGNIAANTSRTFNLVLENKGNTDVTATFGKSELVSTKNASNKISADNIVFGSDSIDVPYKKSSAATVRVSVPLDTPKEQYVGNVIVNFDSKQIISTLTVNVSEPVYTISMPGTISFNDAERNSTQTSVFTIKNTGSSDLTAVRLSANAGGQYNISFNATEPFDIGVGKGRDIRMNLRIPQNEPATNHSIGTISVTSNEKSFPDAAVIYADVASRIGIEDIDFFIYDDIDGKDVSDTNVADGATIGDKARPGSEIRMDFQIKNRFSDDTKVEIRDILITAKINAIEEEEDVEIEGKEFDLGAGQISTRQVLRYTLPLIVADDTYRIDITVEGTDDNDIEHVTKMAFFLKVAKKSHELVITKTEINPASVSCDRKATLSYQIINAGDQNEDEVAVEVVSDALGFKNVESDVLIEKGTEEDNPEYEKSVPLTIGSNLSAGTYPIAVKAYYSEDILNDMKQVNIEVKNCEEKKKETVVKAPEAKEGTSPKPKQPSVKQPDNAAEEEEVPLVTEKKSFFSNPLYLGLLILTNIVVLGGIIAVTIKLLKK